MRRKTSMTPSRVGLQPTLRIVRSDRGIIAAATRKNAAEEMSPGMRTSWPERSCPPRNRNSRTINRNLCAKTAQHDLGMIAGFLRLFQRRRTRSLQRRQQYCRLHLSARYRHSGSECRADRRRQSPVAPGRCPFCCGSLAPIKPSGSMMRCIGRWRNDESPSNLLLKGCPAKSPDNSRIVVPELPQSTGLPGAQSPSQPFPSTHKPSPSRNISTPIWRKALTVRELSSPPERLKIRLLPCATLPRMTARCAIDLSPGTVISPCNGWSIGSMRFMIQR